MHPPNQVLWDTVTAPAPAFPRLTSDVAVDVAVVGGGLLGLSAAMAIAEAGQSVAVLEAHGVGAGASGRNAGFVVPHLSRASPEKVIATLGEQQGAALLALLGQSGDRLFELASRFALGRDARQTGWLQPAHSLAMAAELRRRVEDWQVLGRPVRWLDPEEAKARTPIRPLHGALFDPSGGVINPLAIVRALAGAVVAAGGAIHERSSADVIEAAAGGWRIRAGSGGRVQARSVLLATNAGMLGLGERLGRTVLPLSVYQIATDPLARDLADRISPGREAVSDTRTDIFTYRFDADDRLISGGMALVPLAAERRMARRIHDRLSSELRLAELPPVRCVWRGTAAMTSDGLPRLVTFGSHFWGAVGCNGRGVAFSVSFGEAIGAMLAGRTTIEELPLPLSGSEPLPLRAVARAAPSLVLLRGRLRDRRASRAEARRSGAAPY